MKQVIHINLMQYIDQNIYHLPIGGNDLTADDFTNDSMWSQYWYIDITDERTIQSFNGGEFHSILINPIYFSLDSYPSVNNIRMSDIIKGVGEIYLIDRSVYLYGNYSIAEQNFINESGTYTGWFWIGNFIYDSITEQFSDNTFNYLGQIADIGCKKAINSINITFSKLQNTRTDTEYCFNTTGRTSIPTKSKDCIPPAYYPPMGYGIAPDTTINFYCYKPNLISQPIDSWDDCQFEQSNVGIKNMYWTKFTTINRFIIF